MDAADTAVLIIRVVLGGTMIAHGVNHWLGGGRIAGTARWFSGLGLRRGTFQAWASVVVEIGAGVLLILGLLTPFASAATISVMAVAGFLAHRQNGFFVFRDGYEYVLVLAAAALALAMLGPGAASVDAVVGIELAGWSGGAVALGLGALAAAGLIGTFWRPDPSSTECAKTEVEVQ